MTNPWHDDKLGYEAIGATFTNLVKTIDETKVISIEAGFGRGKTFFRTAWARQLQNEDEVVVEIDLKKSDHSGDPIVTLLGALLDKIPTDNADQRRKAFEGAKRVMAVAGRATAKAVLKSGADEVINYISGEAIEKLGEFDTLDDAINEFGDGMSKAAGQLITEQLATEKVRKDELPKQLEALRSALVADSENKRVIIIIDELDRCHPDYAIAVLEAMKLVFDQAGFVFCLMVNADYLERLAQHRFGVAEHDEKYLDKFVDIRLKLEPRGDVFREAVVQEALKLPLQIPFGDDDAFSIEHAAELAGTLASDGQLSMRKTKRILLKIELAMRCYANEPLDASMLVYLAFKDEVPNKVTAKYFGRSVLTPEMGETALPDENQTSSSLRARTRNEAMRRIENAAPELFSLPKPRYRPPNSEGKYPPWVEVFGFLAPHYIPFHQKVLDSVARISNSDD